MEGFLNPISKGERSLDIYHVNHLGEPLPMPSTKKSYNYIFAVVDFFSKFIYLVVFNQVNDSRRGAD